MPSKYTYVQFPALNPEILTDYNAIRYSPSSFRIFCKNFVCLNISSYLEITPILFLDNEWAYLLSGLHSTAFLVRLSE